MVKHNNVLPNVHLRKHWQRNVKVWLNQAGRKSRRLTARRARAAATAPRPLDRLRPSVRCQTIRYSHRPRLGKGFTLAEVKSVGLGVEFARTVGIAIDHRRKNRSQEAFELNKARLTNYLSKLVLFPRHESSPVTKAKNGILNDTPKVLPPPLRNSRPSPLPPSSTPSPPSSSGSGQSASLNSRGSARPAPSAASARSGTTSATRASARRRPEKLPRRTTDVR
jgi:ribosomal protein L13E